VVNFNLTLINNAAGGRAVINSEAGPLKLLHKKIPPPKKRLGGGTFINRERDETQGQLGLKEPNCLLSNEISLAEGF
jgi:hypothetical protein